MFHSMVPLNTHCWYNNNKRKRNMLTQEYCEHCSGRLCVQLCVAVLRKFCQKSFSWISLSTLPKGFLNCLTMRCHAYVEITQKWCSSATETKPEQMLAALFLVNLKQIAAWATEQVERSVNEFCCRTETPRDEEYLISQKIIGLTTSTSLCYHYGINGEPMRRRHGAFNTCSWDYGTKEFVVKLWNSTFFSTLTSSGVGFKFARHHSDSGKRRKTINFRGNRDFFSKYAS